MYFNSLKNIHFDAFIAEENDLHDIEIIDELSKYPHNSLLLLMLIFSAFLLLMHFIYYISLV